MPEGVPTSHTFERGGYVLAIRDGDATRSDPHGLLDGYDPLQLWAIRPDGEVEKHVIDRAYRVRNVAIGPAGILVKTAKAVSEGGVEQLALAGRFEKGQRASRCCDIRPDGTVTTDGSGGLPRVIEFGQYGDKLERIGLRRADLAGPRYWLWRDGAGWSEIEAPPESGPVMATEDGYFVLGKDGRLHFSADLLGWDAIDESPRQPGDWGPRLEYLGDRVLYVSDDQVAWVAPGGLEPTPFGQAVGEAGLIPPLTDPWQHRLLPWPGLEDGLVLIHDGTDTSLFMPGGQSWGLAPLAEPTERGTEFEIRNGQLVQSSHSGTNGRRLAYRAVVTDDRPE